MHEAFLGIGLDTLMVAIPVLLALLAAIPLLLLLFFILFLFEEIFAKPRRRLKRRQLTCSMD